MTLMKKKRFWISILAVILLISTAGPFGGTVSRAYANGTAAVPPVIDGWVQISSADQLIYMDQYQTDFLDKKIRLMNDIRLSGYEWIPFGGNDHSPFSGTFDGRGHRISGVYVEEDTLENLGFFGEVSGVVQNLGIEADITGGNYTGGLTGLLSGGRVDRSYTLGSVQGKGSAGSLNVSAVGGLAGNAVNSVISRSYSAASVKGGYTANMYVGGLVGSQGAGEISDSFATGNVSNPPAPDSFSYIRSAGLAPFVIYGTIKNSYATGHVDTSNSGPFFGKWFGGFVSDMAYGARVIDSYFDSGTTGQAASFGATAKTTSEMRQQSAYTGWDFTNTWALSPSVNDGYPYLRSVILTTEVPRTVIDSPYSFQFEAFNGSGDALTWTATGLPNGLVLDPASGLLHGSPKQAGIFVIRVTATDAGSVSVQADFSLRVQRTAPEVPGLQVQAGSGMGSTKITVDASNTGAGFAYSLTDSAPARPVLGGSLPAEAIAYPMGSDIENVIPGQYLNIYQLYSDQTVQAWSSILLTADMIRNNIPVTGVSIVPAELTIVEGQDPVQLTAEIEPADASNTSVTWESSQPGVASVDPNGRITPNTSGTAAITVTTADGAFQASVTVTVQARATTGTVTGSVYGLGHAPLPQVTVTVASYSNRTETDGHGLFTLTDMPEGDRLVRLSAPGYVTKEIPVSVKAKETTDAGRIDLVAIPDPGTPTDPGTAPSTGGGTVSQSGPAIPASPAQTLTLQINGNGMAVPFVLQTTDDGRSVIRLTMNAGMVDSMFAENPTAVIEVNDLPQSVVKVDLPAGALKNAFTSQPNGRIQLRVDGASYLLPLSLWENTPSEAVATLAIGKTTDEFSNGLKAQLSQQGLQVLAAPVDFSLYTDDKEWTDLDKIYPERSIMLATPVDPNTSTVVWLDGTHRPHFVPSVFNTENGVTEAAFYAPDNSLFAVVQSKRTFADIQDHWAKQDIELLANKLIVNGVSSTSFAPDKQVTRAEFASMLVNAMGLTGQSGAGDDTPHGDLSFSDILPQAWYAEDVAAAYRAGILNGYDDGTFGPNEAVTREQMAAMAARAMEFAGRGPAAASGSSDRLLAGFTDHSGMAAWAQEPIARLIEAKIMQGVGNNAFAPKQSATRAECAAMVRGMLQAMGFMNK